MKKPVHFNEFWSEIYKLQPHTFTFRGLEQVYDHIKMRDAIYGVESYLDPVQVGFCYTEYLALSDYNEKNQTDITEVRDVPGVISINPLVVVMGDPNCYRKGKQNT